MARKEFSPAEMKILNNNPYTLRVTSSRIMFTLEGKEKILELYAEGNKVYPEKPAAGKRSKTC